MVARDDPHDRNLCLIHPDRGCIDLRGCHADYRRGYMMNIPIIANSFAGICAAVASMGYDLIAPIAWNRAPVCINGIWHAEVRHG